MIDYLNNYEESMINKCLHKVKKQIEGQIEILENFEDKMLNFDKMNKDIQEKIYQIENIFVNSDEL